MILLVFPKQTCIYKRSRNLEEKNSLLSPLLSKHKTTQLFLKEPLQERNHVCVLLLMFYLSSYIVSNKTCFFFSFQSFFFYIDKEVHHAISRANKQMNYVCKCQCLTQFNHDKHALTYSNARHPTIIHLPDGLQNKTRNRIKMRKYFQTYSLLLKILLTDTCNDRHQKLFSGSTLKSELCDFRQRQAKIRFRRSQSSSNPSVFYVFKQCCLCPTE